ncbi:hypothetical protein H7F36_16410 [Variovorax sp. PAMC28562]|uniref:hypothetical protein n=1 Tax=Variovorax sp. PAMC28562 TaxID=2762323 RepID=UPI00164E21E1|nr:hypothetical protein [Variovorax sp. PAMC28562]QNK72755.1 hypothetical protein H7F36_16410 [Variovorax sp. PAMC28562]
MIQRRRPALPSDLCQLGLLSALVGVLFLLINDIDSNTQLSQKGIILIIIVAVFLQRTPLSRLGLTRKSL